MKSLSIAEALRYLSEDKYAVSLENAWYRRELYQIGIGPDKAQRVERRFDPQPSQLPYLLLSMANWLPKHTHRILWIDHFSSGFPSQERNFLKSLGSELPSDYLLENPAILLGPFSEDLMDPIAGTPEQNTEAETLISFCTALTVGEWDAKLLTSGSTDYIEFWEGNVLFYSESAEALDRAVKLLDIYELKTTWS